MKIYVVGNDQNCGFCNWKADRVYLVAESQKKADQEYKKYHAGLCGDCLIDTITDRGYDITAPIVEQRQRRKDEGARV